MADRRPNVLLVLTDQERYDCSAPPETRADSPTSASGRVHPSIHVETPTMDSLSADGLRFEHAFTPISICTPARASLLTGRFPHNHGMLNNSHEADAIRANLPATVPTFSNELADVGYECTYTGKWHVGRDQTPADYGFTYLGGSDRHHDDIDDAFREFRRDLDVPLDAVSLDDEIVTEDGTLVSATTPVDVEATRASFLADLTIDAIEEHSRTDAPFFHRLDFLGPHHPYVVPEPYASMYDPAEIDPWESYAETFDGKPRVHENFLDYRGVSSFDWDDWAEIIAKYWGFVTLIDHQLERVLDALSSYGMAADTVVIHTSDHGDFVGTHRQFNKGPLAYDDTYRIPLQVRWPGVVESGTSTDAFVGLQDLAPTVLEIGGVEPPDSMDGQSLVPILAAAGTDEVGQGTDAGRGADSEWGAETVRGADSRRGVDNEVGTTTHRRESAFCQYHGDEFGLYSQRMVRTARYKFVYNGPDVNELYDLEADPAELQNLVSHPGYEEVRAEMAARLVKWMEQTDDPLRRWVPKTLR